MSFSSSSSYRSADENAFTAEILPEESLPIVTPLTTLRLANGELRPFKSGFASPMKLAYDIYGQGPIHLILLSGATQPRTSYLDQVRHFSNYSEFSVLIIDHPGAPGDKLSGINLLNLQIWSTSTMARNMVAALADIGWLANFKSIHICGISLGGLVAMQMALLIPQYIKSMVMVSVYAKYAQPLIRGTGKKIVSGLMTMTGSKRQYAKAELRLLYSKQFLNSHDPSGKYETRREFLINEVLSRVGQHRQSKRGFFGQNWACRWHRVSFEEQRTIAAKVSKILLISGEQDIIVSPMCSKKLQEGLQCRLETFKDCGHSPHMQCPNAFNNLVHDFVRDAASFSIPARQVAHPLDLES